MNNLFELYGYLEHYPSLVTVLTTTAILLVGILGQILSSRTMIPAILFYMLFGTILGKYGFNVINPDVYGKSGLRAIIAICVAIIVFEGGLLIHFRQLKSNIVSVLSLITSNVFITVVSMTFITKYFLGIDLKIAMLYAALVSVTGPTVIAPILKRIHINQKVKSILETEAVLVDAVGVITAVSIFNYITVGQNAKYIDIFNNIFTSLFVGILSGAFCVFVAKRLVNRFSGLGGEIIRLITLTVALASYALGELLSHESGITSVAIAGMVIGNTDFPYKKSIKEFKGDLTMIAITLVFLLLSADLDLKFLLELGPSSILCVLLLMVIVRPVGVFISTFFEKISWKEKLFIASLGPRGIVAASAATFFSVELESFGVEGSNFIKSMVFLTILMTVIVQGGGAGYMAKALNLDPLSTLIVGGGFIGRELATKMQKTGDSIIIIENDEKKVDSLLKDGLYVINADAKKERTFKEKVNINSIKAVVTTSEDDWFNIRVCQIVKNMRNEVEVISVINDIKSRPVFENLGIKTINLREAVVTVISDMVITKETPALNKVTQEIRNTIS